jgi:hypothetical protein
MAAESSASEAATESAAESGPTEPWAAEAASESRPAEAGSKGPKTGPSEAKSTVEHVCLPIVRYLLITV